MFSEARVKNSVHSGVGACVAGVCARQRGMNGRGSMRGGGGMHGGGWHAWWGVACMVGGHVWQGVCGGGMHGGGHAWWGEACMAGGHAWHWVCMGVACMAGGMQGTGYVHGGGTCVAGGMCGGGHAWQGVHVWQGGHAWQEVHGKGCAWGVCMAGGMHGGGHAWQGEHVWWGHAWLEIQPLQRMVRILLECILVITRISDGSRIPQTGEGTNPKGRFGQIFHA